MEIQLLKRPFRVSLPRPVVPIVPEPESVKFR